MSTEKTGIVELETDTFDVSIALNYGFLGLDTTPCSVDLELTITDYDNVEEAVIVSATASEVEALIETLQKALKMRAEASEQLDRDEREQAELEALAESEVR